MIKNIWPLLIFILIVGCDNKSKYPDKISEENNSYISNGFESEVSECAPIVSNTYNYDDRDGKYLSSPRETCTDEVLINEYSADEKIDTSFHLNDKNESKLLVVSNTVIDNDLDGFQVINTNSLTATNLSIDCNDNDRLSWRMVVIYQDIDGDGIGSGAGEIKCIGKSAPYGYSMSGYDPLDNLTDINSSRITDFDIPPSTFVVMESDAEIEINGP